MVQPKDSDPRRLVVVGGENKWKVPLPHPQSSCLFSGVIRILRISLYPTLTLNYLHSTYSLSLLLSHTAGTINLNCRAIWRFIAFERTKDFGSFWRVDYWKIFCCWVNETKAIENVTTFMKNLASCTYVYTDKSLYTFCLTSILFSLFWIILASNSVYTLKFYNLSPRFFSVNF